MLYSKAHSVCFACARGASRSSHLAASPMTMLVLNFANTKLEHVYYLCNEWLQDISSGLEMAARGAGIGPPTLRLDMLDLPLLIFDVLSMLQSSSPFFFFLTLHSICNGRVKQQSAAPFFPAHYVSLWGPFPGNPSIPAAGLISGSEVAHH